MTISQLEKAHLPIAGAWLLHTASWFLPVVKFGGCHWRVFGPVPGWMAFRAALSAVWPYEDVRFDAWYYAALSTVSAVTTLLFIVVSPWAVWRGSRLVQKACAWGGSVALIVNAHWYVLFGSDRKALSIGYFLWWGSFGLLAIGMFGLLSRRNVDEFRQANRTEPQVS